MQPFHPSSMDQNKPAQFQSFVLFLSFCSFALSVNEGKLLLPITDVDDHGGNTNGLTTYIVYVEKPQHTQLLSSRELEQWHESFLPNTTLDSGEPRLIYSYRDVISGFAARLTPEEVKAMEAMDGFVYARPDSTRQIETTYTPQFLGLSRPNQVWDAANMGEGIVVGVLDSGIFPSHPSFSDQGMPPPPTKFKGSCSHKSEVTCNYKIVGARAFNKSKKASAVDDDGHGTHVSSTVAGNFVKHAEVLGMAPGTASGMAPRAHLSIYKVCFKHGCDDSDILAGIERAIKDRVDIITMSLGGDKIKPYALEGVEHGSLSALRHDISAVAAAGNSGPSYGTLSHDAPWVLTVGASSTDRRIQAVVKLGNGMELAGESAYQPSSFNSSTMLPIAYPGGKGRLRAKYCAKGSLNLGDVTGKIVLCWVGLIDNIEKGKVVHEAGGAAMILINEEEEGYTTDSQVHVLPVSHLSFKDGLKLVDYYSSAKRTATSTIIFNATVFGNRPSPAIASFSSRGPGYRNGGILKPDIVAPGVNILGAWPSKVGSQPPTSTFKFLSGTSMATPHVAGIMALIKKKHPEWSPSAIQSAIITSADDRDLDSNYMVDEHSNETASIFAVGAGQVNPSRALDPGLVYEIDMKVYPGYLCSLGYSDKEVKALWGRKVHCKHIHHVHASELNYPSITIDGPGWREVITIKRSVKNVAESSEHYHARITAPPGVTVELSTHHLRFFGPDQEESFTVSIAVNSTSSPARPFSRGKLEWISKKHVVRSPIVVHWI